MGFLLVSAYVRWKVMPTHAQVVLLGFSPLAAATTTVAKNGAVFKMVSEACVCDHFCRSIWYDMTGMQQEWMCAV